jgi:hypothetical protein
MPGLPHAAAPDVGEDKIQHYLLARDHPTGGSKARYFLAHGFSPQAWTVFADALRAHGVSRELRATRESEFGTKYEVACALMTPDGRNPCIVSIWIVENGAAPRLVTAYPAG